MVNKTSKIREWHKTILTIVIPVIIAVISWIASSNFTKGTDDATVKQLRKELDEHVKLNSEHQKEEADEMNQIKMNLTEIKVSTEHQAKLTELIFNEVIKKTKK